MRNSRHTMASAAPATQQCRPPALGRGGGDHVGQRPVVLLGPGRPARPEPWPSPSRCPVGSGRPRAASGSARSTTLAHPGLMSPGSTGPSFRPGPRDHRPRCRERRSFPTCGLLPPTRPRSSLAPPPPPRSHRRRPRRRPAAPDGVPPPRRRALDTRPAPPRRTRSPAGPRPSASDRPARRGPPAKSGSETWLGRRRRGLGQVLPN